MIINWREEIIKLFPDTTERKIPEGSIICPVCNGLGLYTSENKKYISVCSTCYGKGCTELKVCKTCGVELSEKYYYTICEKCREEDRIQRELERYEKAEKIKIADYDGMLFSLNGENIIDVNDLLDELEALKEQNIKWMFGTKSEPLFSIDLQNIIADECEDGYEDMISFLDMKSEKLVEAQRLIHEWEIENEGNIKIYYPDYNKVILLD